MKNIAEAALEMLRSGAPVALSVVLESSGSTPRAAGSAMLIRADKSIVGTIGGGVLEAHVMNAALKVIADKKAAVVAYVLEETGAAAIGAACGGTAKVLVDYIDPGEPGNIAFFEALSKAAVSSPRAHLAALIPSSGLMGKRHVCLILPDGPAVGSEVFGADVHTLLQSSRGYDVFTKLENFAAYLFPVGSDGTVYIFGAGHCGEKLAHIAHTVGFETVVIDDRADFANRVRFPDTDEILVPKKLDEPFDSLQLGADAFIVIVTRGHMHDEVVLRRALKTDAGYIGMIGSKKKRETIYSHLLRDGFTTSDIARVHSPIGISIGAESPEEIAVSITAELIQVRAEKKRGE